MRSSVRVAAPVDWLIVGLGNPGREYQGTRHNVGFAVAEHLRQQWEFGTPKTRSKGLLVDGKATIGFQPDTGLPLTQRVALLWPQTYMNDSGESVGLVRGSLHVPLDRVLVVHDEIDLPFGEIRTRLGGGLAGHNGLKSIDAALGSRDFQRVRVGVGRPASTDPEVVAAYVLGKFREPEAEVRDLIERAARRAQQVLEAAALAPDAETPR
jgi:PTH1 family peptidyl-tRNA hydrolase